MHCTYCGMTNDAIAFRCTFCGARLSRALISRAFAAKVGITVLVPLVLYWIASRFL